MNIINDVLFLQLKLRHRCSNGLYRPLKIIAIVTTRSLSCFFLFSGKLGINHSYFLNFLGGISSSQTNVKSLFQTEKSLKYQQTFLNDSMTPSRIEVAFNINFPASICLIKINNENIRAMCKICSKLAMETTERR